MDEAPLGNMLLWRWRRRLPSAAGTAEPRPGGRGGGGRGGGGGSRCGRACVPPSGPPQRRARPAASPGPGRAAPGCRSPDLPRFTAPARHGGGRRQRGWPEGPAPPRGSAVAGRWLWASPGALRALGCSAPPSPLLSRSQPGLRRYFFMPVCKRLLFTFRLQVFEVSKSQGYTFFLGCPLQIPKTFNVYLLQSDSTIHNYLKVIVTVCLL